MKFMMLMIPAVYQGGKKVDPNFATDPKKMETLGRFNDEMAKALTIESLNGLHPVNPIEIAKNAPAKKNFRATRQNATLSRPLHRRRCGP